jgi:hypothetical protein
VATKISLERIVMPKRVDFLNPEFQKGTNSTVRLNDRSQDYYPGQMIALYQTGADTPTAYGEVHHILVRKYSDVTEKDIQSQHDIETRTLAGLDVAMVKAYGSKIHGDSYVTIIYFEVKK